MLKGILSFIISLLVVIIGIMAVYLIKVYRDNKILLTTFDTSHYYSTSPTHPLSEKDIVLFFGDSRIRQWHPLPNISGTNTLNRGISGETTAQMMLRFHQDVLEIKPKIVVIEAGINDLVAASMADAKTKISIYQQCIKNIKTMVDLANRHHITVVLLDIIEPYKLGLFRSLVWGNDLTDLVRKANRELLPLVKNQQTYLLSATHFLQQSNKQWKPGVNKDALHFNDKAYYILNDEIIRLVQSI